MSLWSIKSRRVWADQMSDIRGDLMSFRGHFQEPPWPVGGCAATESGDSLGRARVE